MASSTFREEQEIKEEVKEEKPVITGPVPDVNDGIERPYTDTNNFLEDYFKLGHDWKDPDANFFEELGLIDQYIKYKIKEGDIENSPKAVEGLLKGMEKINNLTKEGRAVVKLEVMANYVEFLMKNMELKSKLRRYAN